MERAGEHFILHNLDFLEPRVRKTPGALKIKTDLYELFEFFVLYSHVLYRVQERNAIRESSMHFEHALPDGFPRL